MGNKLQKIKESGIYRFINAIASSAMIGLVLALCFFAYEVYLEHRQEANNNKHFLETVKDLDQIRQSLSTRYLGNFPSYLKDINVMFNDLQPQDTVIIFEDVLYYGIKSCPHEFRLFNHKLLNHARQGGVVVVAYYDNHSRSDVGRNTIFHRMILEGRIAPQYITAIQKDKIEAMKQKKNGTAADKSQWRTLALRQDSTLTEKYFRKTHYDNKENTQKEADYITAYLKSNLINPDTEKGTKQTGSETDVIINRMCLQLDSIKHHHLGNGKRPQDVCFVDYEKMYTEMDDCIAEEYRRHGIELIPLNEYLTMSCWLIKPHDADRRSEAILAFPSKYATDEIGFYSQDASFAQYISTMLNGVRENSDMQQLETYQGKD